jgi:hydroxyethylthiazole kinase-like uncharacterized protein yjeF
VLLERFTGAAIERLYTAADARALDRRAIDAFGIAGIVLMKRAGRAAWTALLERWPDVDAISVVCGRGNNAGDGYVVAGCARAQGVAVQLIQLGSAAALTGDAALARDWAVAGGVEITEVDAAAPRFSIDGAVVVDGLLGTGIRGAVRSAYAQAIDVIAACGRPVLALDVPSGLCSDTGRVLGCAVRATATVTFIGVKRGLVTGSGPDCVGQIEFAPLDVPAACYDGIDGIAALTWPRLCDALQPRAPTAYKQQSGHVLVIGGDRGMGGAVAMAAEAALRVGAGLVSAATRPEHVAAILARRPEIMVRGVDVAGDLDGLLERASVIALGPGLGRDDWGRTLFERAVATGKPVVVDADGLHALARRGVPLGGTAVITPHPGEAAVLLGSSSGEIQRDRFAAAAQLAERYGAVAVLKGAGTVITSTAGSGVCLHGNPAMASAGMGDALTGIVAGLLAQQLDAPTAAAAGVCLHSLAADRIVARRGPHGLVASELADEAVAVLNDRQN